MSGYQASNSHPSTSSTLAAALSLGTLSFASHNVKAAKLSLTPHHLYYLLYKIEEMGIPVGPMTVRLENIHAEASPANYVSFLNQSQRVRGRSDRDSIHSVSSVRSVMSGMSSLWSGFGLGSSNSSAKTERAKAQFLADLTYLYSAFTKIPCLRLSPDRKARLIGGYEEFPFDTAVPLIAFKNVSALEISDLDFRQFYGWDKLAEQLRSLTIKRANINDPSELLIGIVLDDMDKRRRRSSKAQSSPSLPWPSSPSLRFNELGRANSSPNSPLIDDKLSQSASPKNSLQSHREPEGSTPLHRPRTKSASPSRPSSSSRPEGSHRRMHMNAPKVKRSGSGSSNSSTHSSDPYRSGSSSNLLFLGILPASKWRFLRHLSLADNSLTCLTLSGLAPLANTLNSMDLSSNLFTEVPDCLASLTALRALNLCNCMIDSLRSLTKSPLPAITALNLRANRLLSIAGVERLLSLERLDLRENKLQDPTELARLTGTPEIHEVWVLRNPFVKTHGNYRVTIFNLFRSTPGYSEDIIIDSSGPAYNERRQLRTRIFESEGVPVVKPIPIEAEPSFPTLTRPDAIEDEVVVDHIPKTVIPQRPSSQTTQSEIAVGSGRRKKGPRRRIVDLARDDSPPIFRQISIEGVPETPLKKAPGDLAAIVAPRSDLEVLPPLDVQSGPLPPRPLTPTMPDSPPPKNTISAVSNRGRSLATEIQSLNLNGEAYRQKIEALKDEVGSNWLSVLSDQGWNEHRKTDGQTAHFNRMGIMPEPPTLRASSQGIVSGSRTLG